MKSKTTSGVTKLKNHIDFSKLIPEEERQIPFIKKVILSHSKKGEWVKSNEIIPLLRHRGLRTGGGRFRSMINHIRINGIIPGLIAGNSGYFISNDPEQIKDYITTLFSREKEIKRVRQSLSKYYTKLITQTIL